MTNVPNLRFKEFSGEWEGKKIRDIFSLSSGTTPSKLRSDYFNGDILWVTSGELKRKYISSTIDKISDLALKESSLNLYPIGTFVIAIYGLEASGTRGSCGILKKEATISQACMGFIPKQNVLNEFIYYWYLRHGEVIGLKYPQGTKQQNLSTELVGNLNVLLPTLQEQEKIASFFSLIDKKIELQTEKVEELKNYKKGIMQKIFSQELRFKDENGNEYPEWEEVSLHQIGGTYTGLSGKTKADFGFGHGRFVTYINVFNNTLAKQVAEQVNVSEKENQSLVLKGDLLFTTSSETPNEVGMVSCWNYEMQNLYLNSFCFGYRIHNQDSYLPIFLAYMLRSGEYRKKISILAQGSTRYNISKTELMKMKVQCPCMEEQQKIVALLLNLESKVEHEQNKLNEFIQYKKGLLQQMFI